MFDLDAALHRNKASLRPPFTGFRPYCSALKMTKCQPLKEISELFLPRKRLRKKKVNVPELFKYFNFFSANILRVDTKNSGGTDSGTVRVL